MYRFILSLLTLTLALPVFAADGVLEINQACAVNTGCFAGDAAGFPVTLNFNAGRSYRLTGDLTVPVNFDGLLLVNDRMTVDFGGFSLLGPSLGAGTGNGVGGSGTDGAAAGFATIKNGVIRGFRAKGIALGGAKGVRIENMTFDFNLGGGAQVGDEARILKNGFSSNGGISLSAIGLETGVGALIEGNVVSGSGGDGIIASTGSLISENVVTGSGARGISCGVLVNDLFLLDGCTVSRNTASGNGSRGISVGNGAAVTGNTVRQNGASGILAGTGSTISGNTAFGNGNHGISAGLDAFVRGNTVYGNLGDGLSLSGAIYRENVVTFNQTGTVTGGGTNRGDNYCSGTGTVSAFCP